MPNKHLASLAARARQRGYSLLELTIAVAVVAILLGGALMPLQARLERQHTTAVQSQLNSAKEAVHAYMLAHKTLARQVLYYDGVRYPIPSGRPYLPCPDVDGDGVEDRYDIESSVDFIQMETGGDCKEQKGMLPWLTLGLPELDVWGNRLTYRVDAKFSNSLLGFDESFFADVFNATLQLQTNSNHFTRYGRRGEEAPVVCDEFTDDPSTGGCPNEGLNNIIAGVYTDSDITLGHRPVPDYEAIGTEPTGQVDGAVFVILSHGRDGNGAIGQDNRCNPPPALATELGEIANAYYMPSHPFRSKTAPYHHASCMTYVHPTPSLALYENQFVSRPISKLSNADYDAFDDILIWSGSKEITGYLVRAGVIPVPRLQFLPDG